MPSLGWAARTGRRLILVSAAALWLACGGGGGLTAPTTGSIEVTTSTTGSDLDPDGYTLMLDQVEVRAIGVAASTTLEDVAPGSHRVGLAGLAANCTVQGDNPRTIVVDAGEVSSEALAVVCTTPLPETGGVSVTTTTTGVSPDADGYIVTVDGDGGRPIGAGGSLAVADLAAGDHLIGLTGVAANCTVAGANPRTASVVAGSVASVDFAVSCAALPPAAGTLTITTVTTGPGTDADGYAFAIGDGGEQPIGSSTSVTIDGVPAGATTVRLSGLGGNCALDGDNPRPVEIPDGGSAEVTFTVTCAVGTGAIEVTTTSSGSPPDPSGYTVSVDGGPLLAIGGNASRLIEALAPGSHTVALGGLAANCAVQGPASRSVTVVAGQTATVAFTVVCAATTGGLTVTVAGLPGSADADITVTGPEDYSEDVTETRTLSGLAPGQYTVAAAGVTAGGTTYSPDQAQRTVSVAAGATAAVSVTYVAAAGPSLNLRITGLNLTQSVQTFSNEVPLVVGRDGFLRVTVLANETNTVAPAVRVRLFHNTTLAQTYTLNAPGGSVPTQRTDGILSSTWNVPVPGSLIRGGLAIVADVDPGNVVAEADENDNSFPLDGRPGALAVRDVPTLALTLIPVRQAANELQGDVSAGNADQYLDFARRIYPLAGSNAQVHDVYTTTTTQPLQPDDANGAWSTVLSEIALLRITENSDRTYYGVVKTGYGAGLVGRGFLGVPVAIGYDEPDDRARIAAHELGHTWDRQHAPCGGPEGPDADYPYPQANIGRFGFDVQAGVLKPRETKDVMSYCASPWISDYTYVGVMNFRGTALIRASSAAMQPALLVWGRIEQGRVILEPSFHVVTRPVLPARRGAYSVEGTSADGTRLFSLSFDPTEAADDVRGGRHFAFAVPLDASAAARLDRIRLDGPGAAASVTRAPAALRAGPATAPSMVRVGGGVALQWDAAAHPMVMVRDPRTGQILSLARGGAVTLPSAAGELELVLSDGPRSRSTILR